MSKYNYQDPDFDPYFTSNFGENETTPYIEGMDTTPVQNYEPQESFYPLQSSTATPYLNQPMGNYKKGGAVSLAEMIHPKSKNLAKGGLLRKPGKALKSVIGGGAGSLLGNMIAPGIGGIIGGALGQGIQNGIRGKNPLEGAIKGASIGMALPSAASGLGWTAGKLGANGIGNHLTNYGAENAIFPSLAKMIMGGNALGEGIAAGDSLNLDDYSTNDIKKALGQYSQNKDKDLPFWDRVKAKSEDFFTDPKNLLTLASTGYNIYANRPKKEKSAHQLGLEDKQRILASRLTPQELREEEAYLLERERQKRRIQRNKFLPEERLGPIEPVYTRTHTPEEYARTGQWLSYHDTPQYRKGGKVKPQGFFEEQVTTFPMGLSYYLQGHTGGQDDKIPALLSDGEYVIDASTVSDLGDGNSAAGAAKLDEMRENIRKHKRGGKIGLPPKAKSLADYMR